MVELVRLYSNPQAMLRPFFTSLLKARSATRPEKRPVARRNKVRLDFQQATAIAAAYATA